MHENLTEDTERPHTIYRTPAQLAEQEPDRLRRKSCACAVIIHTFALSIGLACTVLIGFVVVTFDADTTKSWLLATSISVAAGWVLEPFKALAIVVFMSFVKVLLCSKAEDIRDGIQNMATMARVTAAMAVAPANANANTNEETRDPEFVPLDFAAVEQLAITRGFDVPRDWVRV